MAGKCYHRPRPTSVGRPTGRGLQLGYRRLARNGVGLPPNVVLVFLVPQTKRSLWYGARLWNLAFAHPEPQAQHLHMHAICPDLHLDLHSHLRQCCVRRRQYRGYYARDSWVSLADFVGFLSASSFPLTSATDYTRTNSGRNCLVLRLASDSFHYLNYA
jgi:hypothetical protein